MRKAILIGSIVTAVLGSTATYAGGWKPIAGDELMDLLSNQTGVGKNFVVFYSPDGVIKGKWAGQKHIGQYYTNEEGHYCAKWEKHGDGEEGCWTAEHKDGKKVRYKPASGRADNSPQIKLKWGNTKKL